MCVCVSTFFQLISLRIYVSLGGMVVNCHGHQIRGNFKSFFATETLRQPLESRETPEIQVTYWWEMIWKWSMEMLSDFWVIPLGYHGGRLGRTTWAERMTSSTFGSSRWTQKPKRNRWCGNFQESPPSSKLSWICMEFGVIMLANQPSCLRFSLSETCEAWWICLKALMGIRLPCACGFEVGALVIQQEMSMFGIHNENPDFFSHGGHSLP